MSSPHAVTIIAKSQTEVADKITELIASVDVGVDEIIDFEVCTYGANQFLITLIYQDIWTIRSFITKIGIKVGEFKRSFSVNRSFVGKVGLNAIFWALHGAPVQIAKLGLNVAFAVYQGVYNQWLISKAGLKAFIERTFVSNRAFPSKLGYHQKINISFTLANGHVQYNETILG